MVKKKVKKKNVEEGQGQNWLDKMMCDPKIVTAFAKDSRRYSQASNILLKEVRPHDIATLLSELREKRDELTAKTRLLNEWHEDIQKMLVLISAFSKPNTEGEKLLKEWLKKYPSGKNKQTEQDNGVR